jgi:RNA polymerase sigma factor (sigma-70 family)
MTPCTEPPMAGLPKPQRKPFVKRAFQLWLWICPGHLAALLVFPSGSPRPEGESIMARHKKIRDKYFINLNGQKIEVTREVYEAWYGGERKERYLEERERDFGVYPASSLTDADGELDPLDAAQSSANTEEEVEQKEEYAELYKALHTLPEKERTVLHQLFFEELTIARIAELEGLDESSIRWRRGSAIKKLKKYFEKI